MDASRAKARLTRKSRPSDGGRGAKAARPVHPAKGMSGRVPRASRRARDGRQSPRTTRFRCPPRRWVFRCCPRWRVAVEAAAGLRAEDEEAVEGERTKRLSPPGRPRSRGTERGRRGRRGGRGGERRPSSASAATTSRRASSRCTSATWRSSMSCVRSRSSRRRATSSRWSSISGERCVGFAPGTGWILDIVERELGKPLPEAKLHRAAAERARRKSSIQARSRFEKAGAQLAVKLRAARHRPYLHRCSACRDSARRPCHEGPAHRGDDSLLDLDQGVRGLRADR